MEIFRYKLNNHMSNRFDAFVNKVLAESLQGGNISSIPSAMRGVGKTDSNTPPSPDPQITSAQNLPKAPETYVPKTMPKKEDPKDQEIKNEISKLPPDVQQKIASAKNVEEITSAIANVDPSSKQKIEDYIKNYTADDENPSATPQNTPSI
jgi:hypothetical protein